MIPTQTQDTTGTPAMTINRPPLRFRHEYKHLISPSEDAVLSGRLGRLFPRDSHARPSGTYRVCSLYFDTPDDRALRQKLNGTDNREKFRIRYYGDSADFFRLEKKIKKNTLCAKRSASLTEEEVQMILEGRHDFLLESPNGLLVEFYSKLKGQLLTPRTVVSYEREAFVYPPGNVRVTLDRHIRRGLSPERFLFPQSREIPADPGHTILEVKYDAFLPDIVRMAVQVPGRAAGAYSKYAACRRCD